jgi:hypothetical protein
MKKRTYVATVQGCKNNSEIDSYFRERNNLSRKHWSLASTKCELACFLSREEKSLEPPQYIIIAVYEEK